MLFLGNGFSIDMMKQLGNSEKICLSNLFSEGMNVPWPETNKPGFLSYQYCPNLWTLGARPYINEESALSIIENVITCANILPQRLGFKNKIYIKAYNELEQYLMSLFVYYTNMVKIRSKKNLNKIEKWGWTKFFKKLNSDSSVDKVFIVSLNYDIWLEQLFEEWGIEYTMDGLSSTSIKKKFIIYKPHGSIAFHSVKRDKSAYAIPYSETFDNHKIDEFSYDLNNLDCLNLVNALIPPAGDSTRMKFAWSVKIKKDIMNQAKKMTKDDVAILCGLSYWHVDRSEIDDYLSYLPMDIKDVIMVNPNPPEVLNAVLMTLFNQYNVYDSSDNLLRI